MITSGSGMTLTVLANLDTGICAEISLSRCRVEPAKPDLCGLLNAVQIVGMGAWTEMSIQMKGASERC